MSIELLIKDFNNCRIYSEHQGKTSAVAFSPKGGWIASGGKNLLLSLDSKGEVRIWSLNKETGEFSNKKSYQNFVSEKVRDIAWSENGDRVCAVGEGKNT